MSNKIICFLLLVNIAFTGFIGYRLSTRLDAEMSAVKTALSFEPNIVAGVDKKYRDNVYKALSMILSGQGQLVENQQTLSIGLLRVHHFVEPHSDKFYNNCPECQKEKAEIIKKDSNDESTNTKYGIGD